MTSQLNVDTIVDKAGSGGTNVKIANTSVTVAEGGSGTTTTVQGLAKVWFNVNQEGTQAFRDSFNCSSLSDQNTGVTRVAFTNALANGDYAAGGMSRDSSGGSFGIVRLSDPMSTTEFQFVGESHDDTNIDCNCATVNINGDLA